MSFAEWFVSEMILVAQKDTLLPKMLELSLERCSLNHITLQPLLHVRQKNRDE